MKNLKLLLRQMAVDSNVLNLLAQGGMELREEGERKEALMEQRRKTPFSYRPAVKPLPNVKTFEIILRTWDFIGSSFGIRRKHSPEINIVKLSGRITRLNRYVLYQFNRAGLSEERNKGSGWPILIDLLKHSTAFKLMALRKVSPHWHMQPMWLTAHWLRRLGRLSSEMETLIEFRRVYIEKANGKKRPLGVPKVEWRMYLHQISVVLSFLLSDKVSSHQHGFIPGRGVLTAGKEIMTNVIGKPNIYEYDLRGFFDRVKISAITDKLRESGTPEEFVTFIHDLCLSRPSNQDLKDPGVRKKILASGVPTDLDLLDMYNEAKKIEEISREFSEARTKLLLDQYRANLLLMTNSKELTGGALTAYEKAVKSITAEYKDGLQGGHWSARTGYSDVAFFESGSLPMRHVQALSPRGVPQGAAISPLLAITVLDPLLKQQHHVQYADDGLFYGRKVGIVPRETDEMSQSGIEVNGEKSGGVRRNGKWLKPLKFLGMEYDGIKRTFRARTRNGATLEFTANEAALLLTEHLLGKEEALRFKPYESTDWGVLFIWAVYGMLGDFLLGTGFLLTVLFAALASLGVRRFITPVTLLEYIKGRFDGTREYLEPETELLVHLDEQRQLGVSSKELSSELSFLHFVEQEISKRPLKILFNSERLGFIFNRMQCDAGNLDLDQDFSPRFSPGSWWAREVPRRKRRWELEGIKKVSIFNGSSLAFLDLSHRIHRWKTKGGGNKY